MFLHPTLLYSNQYWFQSFWESSSIQTLFFTKQVHLLWLLGPIRNFKRKVLSSSQNKSSPFPLQPATSQHLYLIIFSHITVSLPLEKHMETAASKTFQQPVFSLHYGRYSVMDASLAGNGSSSAIAHSNSMHCKVHISASLWLVGGHLELMYIHKERWQRQKVDCHRADSQYTLSALLPSFNHSRQKPIPITTFCAWEEIKHRKSWVFSAYIHYILSDWA